MRHRCSTRQLLQLLRWTADYYHHPLGEVIAAALPRPCARARRQRPRWSVALPLRQACSARRRTPPRRAPRQQALLALLAAHARRA